MSSIEINTMTLADALSERFGIDWDPDVMAYEEPHIFKSTQSAVEEPFDAER